MIPREPHRRPQLGFLYVPPYRVQGLSVAGEETVVQVPELDVVFDIGRCPRAALTSNFVALSHGHMDHSAGLAYYFSQRHFQGMGAGTVICHPSTEAAIHNVMRAWVDLEAQRTPYKVVPLAPESEFEVKKGIFLRAFATNHTVPSLGFIAIEKRQKLRPEFVGMTQEQILALRKKGETVTHVIEIPLVCYTGDTARGEHFDRPDVRNAKILITECTFLEPGHRDRAAVGKHMHLLDVAEVVRRSAAEAIVLIHLSRRTHMGEARKEIDAALAPEDRGRVHVLMDSRANRSRYEKQAAEAGGVDEEPATSDEAAGEG